MTRTSLIVLLAAALALAATPSALASDAFADVPNGAPFHDEISIFKTTNITTGCTATTFCPTDFVKRQAMAAFIDRALGLLIRPGETTYKGIPGSRVQILDDDVSLVGTFNGALELSHNGARALHIEGNATSPNLIGGFSGNSVTAGVVGAAIGGGGRATDANSIAGPYSSIAGGLKNQAGSGTNGAVSIGGGYGNIASGDSAAIAGGFTNTASGLRGAVGGGINNAASGENSAVGGGLSNAASSQNSAVAGGYDNTASGGASIAAGFHNTASGDYSSSVGGSDNTASGAYSLAAGANAHATHTGSFVWADATPATTFSSTADNEFSARATGGFRFVSATGSCTIATTGDMSCPTFITASDRNAKSRFGNVDRRTLLRRLRTMPVRTWSFRADPRAVRHIGPTAQDFAEAFNVGADDRHIATVDADGVALAAIQAVSEENASLKARLRMLERTVAELAKTSREKKP